MKELEYYLRLNDPLRPVYEVDRDAATCRLAASWIGTIDNPVWPLAGRGERFAGSRYARVWPAGEQQGRVLYRFHPRHDEYRPGTWIVRVGNGTECRLVPVDADCWYEASFLAPLKAGGEYQQWEVIGPGEVPPRQPEPAGWHEDLREADDA